MGQELGISVPESLTAFDQASRHVPLLPVEHRLNSDDLFGVSVRFHAVRTCQAHLLPGVPGVGTDRLHLVDVGHEWARNVYLVQRMWVQCSVCEGPHGRGRMPAPHEDDSFAGRFERMARAASSGHALRYDDDALALADQWVLAVNKSDDARAAAQSAAAMVRVATSLLVADAHRAAAGIGPQVPLFDSDLHVLVQERISERVKDDPQLGYHLGAAMAPGMHCWLGYRDRTATGVIRDYLGHQWILDGADSLFVPGGARNLRTRGRTMFRDLVRDCSLHDGLCPAGEAEAV